MKNIVAYLILVFIFYACHDSQKRNSIYSKSESFVENESIPDTFFISNKDTIEIFYDNTENIVNICALQNGSILFEEKIKLDDFINDAPFKKRAYIDEVYYTGFENETKEIVFTSYLKLRDDNFKIEATFTLDLNGNFNLITD